RRIALSLASALLNRYWSAITRAERLNPWTLPPAPPPLIRIAGGNKILCARRMNGLYVGTEVADGITGILGLPVLSVGQPFVRCRRFRGSNHVPARFF